MDNEPLVNAEGRAQCVGTTHAGRRCTVTVALSRERLCALHDPKRGARRRVRPPGTVRPAALPGPLMTLEDCDCWAAWIARAVLTGAISTQVAKEGTNAVREKRYVLTGLHDVTRRVRDLGKKLEQAERKS